MADSKLEIGVEIVYLNEGSAARAASDLDAVKSSASQASPGLSKLDDILAGIRKRASDEATFARTKKELEEMAFGAGRAAPQVSDLSDKLEHLGAAAKTGKDGLEIANGNFRQLPGLLSEATGAGDSLVGSLARLGLVGGAFAAGFNLATAAADSFFEVLRAGAEAADAYYETVAAASEASAARQATAFKIVEEARAKVIAQLQHENELNQIERDMTAAYAKSVADLTDAREKNADTRALAKAESPAEKAAIGLAGKGRDEMQESARALADSDLKLTKVEEELAEIEEKRKTVAQKNIALREAMDEAEMKVGRTADGSAERGQAQKDFIRARDAFNASPAGREEEKFRGQANQKVSERDNLLRGRETAQTNFDTKKLDLEGESKTVLKDLADQLRVAKDRALAANAGVADASNKGTGLGGALKEQSAAGAQVARLEGLMQTLTGGFATQSAALAAAAKEASDAQINASHQSSHAIVSAIRDLPDKIALSLSLKIDGTRRQQDAQLQAPVDAGRVEILESRSRVARQ